MSLFGDNTDPATPPTDPSHDYFSELVGPGKKFADQKELARSKIESDNYIKHKESEYDKLREDYLRLDAEYKASKKLQEMFDQINTQPPANTPPAVPELPVTQPQFDISKLDEVFSTKIKQYETARQEENNYKLVQDKLKERYGDNYSSLIKNQSQSLGLTEEMVNSMARQAPQALLRTFGVTDESRTTSFQSPPRNTQLSDSFAPKVTRRNWDHYENLRRNDPAQYTSQKTQVQMHKDAQEQGEAFYT